MAWARHGKCESDTAALCKSNGKDTFQTLSGTAWARHDMCESAFTVAFHKTANGPKINTKLINIASIWALK